MVNLLIGQEMNTKLRLLKTNATIWYNKICKAKQHLNIALSKSVEAVYKKVIISLTYHNLYSLQDCIHKTFPDFIEYTRHVFKVRSGEPLEITHKR